MYFAKKTTKFTVYKKKQTIVIVREKKIKKKKRSIHFVVREAKVGYFRIAAFVEQNVSRRQIAMYNYEKHD